MKKYSLVINGNPYKVQILELTGASVNAEVNGEKFTVAIEDIENIYLFPTEETPRRPRPVEAAEAPPKAKNSEHNTNRGGFCPFGTGNVHAPIPGQIIAIDVEPGDAVKKGQRMLILEAMKMENAITANRDGIIKEVLVHNGEAVTQNQPLVLFA